MNFQANGQVLSDLGIVCDNKEIMANIWIFSGIVCDNKEIMANIWIFSGPSGQNFCFSSFSCSNFCN